jgi:O-antigen/teichoic acid export membrane protein
MQNKPPALTINGYVLARNMILNFLGLALPLIVGVISIPYTIRWLGIDRFGVLSLAWVIVGYFGFLDLGLGRATTKYVAEALGNGEARKVPGYFWTTVLVQAFLGIAGAAILWLVTPDIVDHLLKIPPGLLKETRIAFVILACSLPLVLVSASFRGVLEAAQRFDIVNYVKIPSSILNYILPMIGILVGFQLPGILTLLVLSRAITFIVWILLTFKVFPSLKTVPRYDRHSIKPLLSFGGWVTVSNVVSPVLVYLDRFLIGSLISIEAVGLYAAPYEFVMRLGVIPGSLLMTLFPTFSALGVGGDRQRSEALFGRSVKYLLIVMGSLIVILIVAAKFIIGRWLGGSFVNSSLLAFQILCVGFLANTLANVPFGYLQGIGRADLTAKFHLFELILYFPLTWILVKNWGISGAALSWAVRSVLDMGLLFWASGRFGGMRPSVLSGVGVAPVAGLLSALALAAVFLAKTSWWIFGLTVFTIGFYAATWKFFFPGAERAWIKATLSRLLVGKRIGP